MKKIVILAMLWAMPVYAQQSNYPDIDALWQNMNTATDKFEKVLQQYRSGSVKSEELSKAVDEFEKAEKDWHEANQDIIKGARGLYLGQHASNHPVLKSVGKGIYKGIRNSSNALCGSAYNRPMIQPMQSQFISPMPMPSVSHVVVNGQGGTVTSIPNGMGGSLIYASGAAFR